MQLEIFLLLNFSDFSSRYVSHYFLLDFIALNLVLNFY
jgi:hypothetical protein